MKILELGSYINKHGETVDIKKDLRIAISNTTLYKPDSFLNIDNEYNKIRRERETKKPDIEVTDETTISAAKRLIVEEGINEAVCLNFASAKHPGGGFISGSHAQEESLARSSGLYASISQMKEMYEYNHRNKTCLHSDYMIYSPKVTVFRDDENELLDDAFCISFITAPAVNAEKIHSVMMSRIRKILLVAALHNNREIILGAYGCGVFKNKTEYVAQYFRKVLHEEDYKSLFDKIVFAIYEYH